MVSEMFQVFPIIMLLELLVAMVTTVFTRLAKTGTWYSRSPCPIKLHFKSKYDWPTDSKIYFFKIVDRQTMMDGCMLDHLYTYTSLESSAQMS